jgi:hypothetical protein
VPDEPTPAPTTDTAKVAVLGMPSYGLVSPAAARALFRSTSGEKVKTHILNFESSLLAQSFNVLWAGAMNAVRQGNRVDYFAMLHADVEPGDWWLDALVEELEAKDLDVLSAIVPIKSSKGLTSAGYEAVPETEWRIGGRLTMTEVFRLPETFTEADVGRPLVMNTGCWVCRFDPAWAKDVCFTIRDRIVADENGFHRAEVMPEDWGVSRQFRALGKRIGLTRKVALGHRGPMTWRNERPWGTYAHDEDYLSESIITPTEVGHASHL